MKTLPDKNNPDIKSNDIISGFRVVKIQYIDIMESVYYQLEHVKTGAQYIHISCSDEENTFCAAFKTVPPDATGVAHILEHTTLCGSKKYPVKDPFFSMTQRSLSTFMNAFTSTDWTMYPFSTQNKKDFYNLMDVYLDAVFFPRLDEMSFKQEGHRIEIDDSPGSDGAFSLVYKGVVYNEMKGVMSSADQVLVRSLLSALYPSTSYRFNAGGDPETIPQLTWEELVRFHRSHYHPSNTYFYTYGNLPLREHLRFIDEKTLIYFDKIDPKTDVASQPRWIAPCSVAYPYPVERSEDIGKKYQVCIAWLMCDIDNTRDVLSIALLEQILLANAASPLRKALLESELGTALCDMTGYDDENKDTFFAMGLKNIEEASVTTVEKLILSTLERLVRDGIDHILIEAAIHQIEFHRKEITNSPYPHGLKLLMSFASSWLHHVDPLKNILFDEELSIIKKEIADGPYFEGLIQKYFLDNPHRVTFTLIPDSDLHSKQEESTQEELKLIRERLSEETIEKIRRDMRELKSLQNKREDVSCLPTLIIEDIPRTVTQVSEDDADDSVATSHISLYSKPTSDILYLSGIVGSGMLESELVPLVPFYCHIFSRMGSAVHDYAELSQRIDLYTGGLGLSANVHTLYDEKGSTITFISLNGKSLSRNMESMVDIFRELILQYDFSNLVRLKQLFLEYLTSLESGIVYNGHRLALSSASKNFSSANHIHELWNGISQIRMMKQLSKNLSENELLKLSVQLSSITKAIFLSDNVRLALVGDQRVIRSSIPRLDFLQDDLLKGDGRGFQSPSIPFTGGVVSEGWSTASSVSFVAEVFQTIRMDHEDAPVLSVISKLLRSLYLHREIREKGGAYGGFSVYSPESGIFGFASYRDPHITETLKVYKDAISFLRETTFSDQDIKESILQVCANIDRPDPPGPSAKKAFYRKVLGLTDEKRIAYKSRLLKITSAKVREAAHKYFPLNEDAYSVSIISGESQLETANKSLDRQLILNGI